MATGRIRIFPPDAPLAGAVSLPGDKSISHRALLLNALGEGEARISHLNDGADVRSTASCLRALGVTISGGPKLTAVRGRAGRLRTPSRVLECGNSGTTMRLLAGLLAAQPFTATLDGDASLRARPMRRIAEPLRTLGARVEGPDHGEHAPLIITGGRLREARFDLEVASAQLKSCLLLAGVAAKTALAVREPAQSRDHTERMLAAMGVELGRDGDWIELPAGQAPRCVDLRVPADPSSAALVALCAACVPGSELSFPGLLLNPTRTAFFDKLASMGVEVRRNETGIEAGEAVGEIRVRAPQRLRSLSVEAEEVPALIDEIPALAILAAFAEGRSEFHGIAELRVKESDRVAAIEQLCASVGIAAGSDAETLWVEGGDAKPEGPLCPADDHRMAMSAIGMALGVATRTQREIEVDGIASIAVSFPDFLSRLESLGVRAA